MCAGSKDCYTEFSDLYNPYIRDVHGHFPNQDKIASEMNSNNMIDTNYDYANKLMINTVRISIKRNFDGIQFGPSDLSSEKR
jgi:hypothetical protein